MKGAMQINLLGYYYYEHVIKFYKENPLIYILPLRLLSSKYISSGIFKTVMKGSKYFCSQQSTPFSLRSMADRLLKFGIVK